MMQHADTLARKALYEALRKAFRLARQAEQTPADYAVLMRENGMTPQPEQRIMSILRLVFGPDYDGERLAEYAAALSHAEQEGQTPKTLIAFLQSFEGGIRGCARAAPVPEMPLTAFKRNGANGSV